MKTKNKVGFAVVGLGNIATSSVLPAFANCKRAKLIALVNKDKKKAARLARQFSACAAYASAEYRDCLADPQISAVYIATPNAEHLSYTIEAARAGKHVLSEKPLAATVAQSREMVKACRDAGVQLMTAYRKYFEPSALCLKQLVRRGALGRIDTIHTSFSEIFRPGVSPQWLLDKQTAGGGPLMDLGPYCINTSRWLIDEDPLEVDAFSWTHDKQRFRDVEEGIAFRLRFPSGTVLQGSTTYSAAISSLLYVQGSKGWASLSPAFPFDEERHIYGNIGKGLFHRRFKIVDEFAPEIDAFAAAIQEGRAAEPDGAQGHRDMLITDAIYQSARSHTPVRITYE
jgi:predicted dehydrogenase